MADERAGIHGQPAGSDQSPDCGRRRGAAQFLLEGKVSPLCCFSRSCGFPAEASSPRGNPEPPVPPPPCPARWSSGPGDPLPLLLLAVVLSLVRRPSAGGAPRLAWSAAERGREDHQAEP